MFNNIQNTTLNILRYNIVTQDPSIWLISCVELRKLVVNKLRLATTQYLVLAVAIFLYFILFFIHFNYMHLPVFITSESKSILVNFHLGINL